MPVLDDFISPDRLAALIAEAREEDMGAGGRDITSQSLVPAERQATAVMRSRETGRLAGAALLPQIAAAYDRTVTVSVLMADGDVLVRGSEVATFNGSLRSVLAIERVALNFATHLSGIASLTARYVDAVRGTRAGIYDTRKTIPGLRGLAKYAVVCGGGCNHRIGLHDAVLVKDNHIAHIPLADLTPALTDAIAHARAQTPPPAFIEVEVDTLEQFDRVLACPVDMVLLDNMPDDELRQAVARRDQRAPEVVLEASGGVDLTSVARIAQTGVDRIAVGALTHSAPSLDLGLDIDA